MRTLAKILLGLVVLLIVAFGGIYFALSRIDLSQYVGLANARIQEATGHVVHVDGPLRIAPSRRKQKPRVPA